jgi:threonylcarbamoyladenosine tRNA methylthiotransferase MtaB
VFSYSERPGTMALRIPHTVSPQEKHDRSQQVIALSDRCLDAFYARFMGQVRPVLLEHSRLAGVVHGFTDNYIRVEIKCDPSQPDNVIVPVRLGGWNEAHDALTGEIVTNQPQMSE